jgi:hypothetical protein
LDGVDQESEKSPFQESQDVANKSEMAIFSIDVSVVQTRVAGVTTINITEAGQTEAT